MIGSPLTSVVLLALAIMGFILYVRKHRKIGIKIPPPSPRKPPLPPRNPDITPYPLPNQLSPSRSPAVAAYTPSGNRERERVYPRDNPLPRKLRDLQTCNPTPNSFDSPAPTTGTNRTSRGGGTALHSVEDTTEAVSHMDLTVLPSLIRRLNDTLARVGEAPPRYESAEQRV